MAAESTLIVHRESLSGVYNLESYLEEVLAQDDLGRSLFFVPWEHVVQNTSDELLKQLKKIREGGGLCCLNEVESLETASVKYFDLQKKNPNTFLKFFKEEGTTVRWKDVKFGFMENWFGGGRNKGNAIQWLHSENYRRNGDLKQKVFPRVFYFHPDMEVCDALASEAEDALSSCGFAELHCLCLTPQESHTPFQNVKITYEEPDLVLEKLKEILKTCEENGDPCNINVDERLKQFLLKKIQGADGAVDPVEVKRLKPHVVMERIEGWTGLGEYITKNILSQGEDLSDITLVFDLDKTVTAPWPRSGPPPKNKIKRLRGGLFSFEACVEAKRRGASFYICTARADHGNGIKLICDTYHGEEIEDAKRKIFMQTPSGDVPHFRNLYNISSNPASIIKDAFEKKSLKFKIPQSTKQMYFFHDFVGNPGAVQYDFLEENFCVPDVHAVWWDAKIEETEGKIRATRKGGADDSYNEELELLTHFRNSCNEGFSPRTNHDEIVEVQQFDAAKVVEKLEADGILSLNIPTCQFLLNLLS